jgi:hypothetical protein
MSSCKFERRLLISRWGFGRWLSYGVWMYCHVFRNDEHGQVLPYGIRKPYRVSNWVSIECMTRQINIEEPARYNCMIRSSTPLKHNVNLLTFWRIFKSCKQQVLRNMSNHLLGASRCHKKNTYTNNKWHKNMPGINFQTLSTVTPESKLRRFPLRTHS